MRSFDVSERDVRAVYGIIANVVAPRPIALVATISRDGRPNLAPFSFFNIASIAPPVLMISSLVRMRDGSIKDTWRNLLDTGVCTIQAVSAKMLHRQTVTAVDFRNQENEFEKSGFTPLASDRVAAPRVAEAHVQFECRLYRALELGSGGGAGQIAFCEIVRAHLEESLFDDDKLVAARLELAGRLGGDDYVAVNGSTLSVPLPRHATCLGVSGLPLEMRTCLAYSAEELARFALCERLPTLREVRARFWNEALHLPCAALECWVDDFRQARTTFDVSRMLSAAVALASQHPKARATREAWEHVARSLLDEDSEAALAAAVMAVNVGHSPESAVASLVQPLGRADHAARDSVFGGASELSDEYCDAAELS